MKCERCDAEPGCEDNAIYISDPAGNQGIGFLCGPCWEVWDFIVLSGHDDDEGWPLSA
jgi:hypothetical protein